MPARNETAKYLIKNDVTIVAPRSLQLLTPFVLMEQHDWFEDEIKFLRHYLKAGMKILDIGANYGVYTLTMAKIIGSSGRLWAFEPAAATANSLAESIKANKLANITLLEAGLSDRTGKAKLFTSDNTELNSLTRDAVPDAHSETINLLTLDYCMDKYSWKRLDFIKLDAEGEEFNILRKAKNTLTALSPLIMFEFKHADSINLSLISGFKSLGYHCYRLIPVLNILVPFNHHEVFDSYQLNLFCCKGDKSIQLEEEGWLVHHWRDDVTDTKDNSIDTIRKYIDNTTYGKTIGAHLDYENSPGNYTRALRLYVLAISATHTPSEKVGCLMSSFKIMMNVLEQGEQRVERLATLARIAIDAGQRTFGVRILKQLIDRFPATLNFKIVEPFLPATRAFEEITPEGNLNGWLFSSVIEQYIVKSAFSSIFNWRHILPLLERLKYIGFISDDMTRRHELIKRSMETR